MDTSRAAQVPGGLMFVVGPAWGSVGCL